MGVLGKLESTNGLIQTWGKIFFFNIFDIFDDFLKFCSTFGAPNFKKSSNISKLWGKIFTQVVLNTPWHFQSPNTSYFWVPTQDPSLIPNIYNTSSNVIKNGTLDTKLTSLWGFQLTHLPMCAKIKPYYMALTGELFIWPKQVQSQCHFWKGRCRTYDYTKVKE